MSTGRLDHLRSQESPENLARDPGGGGRKGERVDSAPSGRTENRGYKWPVRSAGLCSETSLLVSASAGHALERTLEELRQTFGVLWELKTAPGRSTQAGSC